MYAQLAVTDILTAKHAKVIDQHKGIFLDIGCSDHKTKGSVGMDIRAVEGVDIVHNIEVTPWPLPDACCLRILASHIIEHLDPAKMVDILNEAWRVMKPGGQLFIAMPYAGSPRFFQDPTHKHAWNEVSAQYWDPECQLYGIYYPKPWKIDLNEWQSIGDLQIVLSKRTEEDAAKCPYYGS